MGKFQKKSFPKAVGYGSARVYKKCKIVKLVSSGFFKVLGFP